MTLLRLVFRPTQLTMTLALTVDAVKKPRFYNKATADPFVDLTPWSYTGLIWLQSLMVNI